MMGILLQQDIQFFTTPDASSNRITLIIFSVVAAVLVLAAVLGARRGSKKRAGGATVGLGRQARRMGLDPDQRRALKQLVSGLSLQNPERLLSNSAYLNHALRRRIDQINMLDVPEAERERQKSLLFTIKRTVQNASTNLRSLPSSRQIRVGQIVHIHTAEGQTYETLVTSNVHNGLGVEIPYERRSGSIAWKKQTPLQISFVLDHDRMYAFKTRVVGFNNSRGASVVYVEHASDIRQSQKRRSPRREYDRPCHFYPVTVITVGRGRKAKKQAFVNKNRRIFGRFEDLSAGGCAIKTQVPLSAGSILRVDFEGTDGAPIAVFGKARGVDRSRARGRLMHIMFTRVSRKNLNQIQSYVYGLEDAD